MKLTTFESRMKQLEQLIKEMENENISLDKLSNKYEKALELYNSLNSELEQAKQKFYIVDKDQEVEQ